MSPILIAAPKIDKTNWPTTMTAKPTLSPSPKQALATLAPGHPRILLTNERLAQLKKQMETDPVLAGYAKAIIKDADARLDAPPIERVFRGSKPGETASDLLVVAKDAREHSYSLALAYRLTGDTKYAAKLKQSMLEACAFSDWYPTHFLDVGEFAYAVGIAYDWLYDYLDEDSRKALRQGLIENALKPGMELYDAQAWQVTIYHNWNPLVNGGLLVAALAIADEEPELSGPVIANAIHYLPNAIRTYDPDGAWGEGPVIWGKTTNSVASAAAASTTALGTDYGISKSQGLANTGDFPLYMAGPTGLFFNFSDQGGSERSIRPAVGLAWLAQRYNKPQFATLQQKLVGDKPEPEDFIWYSQAPDKLPQLPLDKLFRGPVEVVSFRSAWDDPNALFVGFKAGFNRVNHGHLDLGSFVLDAMGERFAHDLGQDSFKLKGYRSNTSDDGQRWTYFRWGSQSHNVILMDQTNQLVAGTSVITGFKNGPTPFATTDLTTAYSKWVSSAKRGVMLVGERRAMLVQDEITPDGSREISWNMLTAAKVEPNGQTAKLTVNGKQLTARILSPAGAAFSVESAEQEPPQARNQGFSKLVIRMKEQTSPVTVSVLLSPNWPDGKVIENSPVVPLGQWTSQSTPVAAGSSKPAQ